MKAQIPVQEDAIKLVKHTTRTTLNIKKFPKKYQHNLVDELIRTTIRLLNAIGEANSNSGLKRLEFIDCAIGECRNAEIEIDIIYDEIHPNCSITYWENMAEKIEKQLQNWKADTIKRMKQKK